MTHAEEGSFRGLGGLGPGAILLTGLALSIGWGIRGNFGHEAGAMLPGALAGITVALTSRREDWWRRAPFFGFFGALAWGIGGSMSYMQVIAYTHSGHWPSQLYGFLALYLIGFLWAGLGGAGTALAGVIDQNRLRGMLMPLAFVLAAIAGYGLFIEPRLDAWVPVDDPTWSRHEHLLYWFDSDWLQALAALAAVLAYDLVNRVRVRIPASLAVGMVAILAVGCYLLAIAVSYPVAIAIFVLCGLLVGLFIAHPTLVLYAYVGFYAGHYLQRLVLALGAGPHIRHWLVHYQGMGEAARAVAADRGVPVEDILLANWPDILLRYPTHLGWVLGMAAGVAIYFYRNGRFANGSSLFLYMSLGWFGGFLLFPVLLSFGGGGFRLTPPRGDNWAGVLGMFAATLVWMHRNQLHPVVWAALVSGTFGGLGFVGAVLAKLVMVWPGNTARGADPSIWVHWQEANWHSFLEQTYGMLNGVGLAVVMGILATSKGRLVDNPARGRGGKVFAVAFVLFAVPYLNLVKNIPHWVSQGMVPATMRAPLARNIEFTALTWFNLFFFALVLASLYLMTRHLNRPVALVPDRPQGRGQLLFLVLLWVMVWGNLERQFPRFAEGRLITEWVVAINAVVATVLVLALSGRGQQVPLLGRAHYGPPIWHALRWALIMMVVAGIGGTVLVAGLYGSHPTGHGAALKRFGPEAAWRADPLLRGDRHR